MKTTQSPQRKASAADSSAPAADRPATALDDRETPEPTVMEDPDAKPLLAEDELGNLPLPPEIVSPRLAQLETWDAPAQESGYRVEPLPAEDEAEFPEILAEEGADEAEEELRALEEDEEKLMEREELEEEDESDQ